MKKHPIMAENLLVNLKPYIKLGLRDFEYLLSRNPKPQAFRPETTSFAFIEEDTKLNPEINEARSLDDLPGTMSGCDSCPRCSSCAFKRSIERYISGKAEPAAEQITAAYAEIMSSGIDFCPYVVADSNSESFMAQAVSPSRKLQKTNQAESKATIKVFTFLHSLPGRRARKSDTLNMLVENELHFIDLFRCDIEESLDLAPKTVEDALIRLATIGLISIPFRYLKNGLVKYRITLNTAYSMTKKHTGRYVTVDSEQITTALFMDKTNELRAYMVGLLRATAAADGFTTTLDKKPVNSFVAGSSRTARLLLTKWYSIIQPHKKSRNDLSIAFIDSKQRITRNRKMFSEKYQLIKTCWKKLYFASETAAYQALKHIFETYSANTLAKAFGYCIRNNMYLPRLLPFFNRLCSRIATANM